MSALSAMTVGARRALGSPFILLWLWLLNIAVAAPVAWIVVASLEDGIGASRAYVTLSKSPRPSSPRTPAPVHSTRISSAC
jgi:hypothetical protein